MVFFITGATGFLGRNLCRFLLSSGHRVIALTRRADPEIEGMAASGGLAIHRSDLEHLAGTASGLEADVFIHLAWSGTDKESREDARTQEKNVALSLQMLDLARTMGCSLYVDAGSQAEYGIVNSLVYEETPCHPVTEYGKAKLRSYRESLSRSRALGIKYLHARIFSVFGKGDHSDSLVATAIRELKADRPFSLKTGSQSWNYLYVSDAARMIAILSESAYSNPSFETEVYHIASDDTRPLKDFILSIREIVHSGSPLSFGDRNMLTDVSLEPSVSRTREIVSPLCTVSFEDAIRKML